MNKLITRSFLNALGTTIYIVGLVTSVLKGDKLFGQIDVPFAPIIFLMVFVLSAGVTGSLVLGKPLLMYLNNQKSEAVKLFLYTLGWLALGVIVVLLVSMKK